MDGQDGADKNFILRLISSLSGLLRARDNISISNIRTKNLKYMLIFALAPIFANMQGALFNSEIRMLGIDAMTLTGTAYCIGGGVIFSFAGVKNMTFVARSSVILTLAGFIPWILMPESRLSLALAILFMFGFGGCAACAAFSYTFALNNTERFFGVAIISLFCVLMELDYGVSFVSGLFDKTYLAVLVAGTAVCLWQYKTEEYTDALKKPEAKSNPALKLMLFFFIAHKFVEIFYTYFPVASTPEALVTNGVMGIFVIGLSFAMQVLAKRSVWNMCNLFFIAMLCTYALYFVTGGSVGREFTRYFHGFEQMGYIASYYLLGCVFKKHGSFHLFKRSLIIILPGCLLLYMIPGALAAFAPGQMVFIATLTTGIIFIAFFLMSPSYSKHLFFSDWSDDFHLADMTEIRKQAEQTSRFEQLELTPTEREIALLLQQGLEIKQIAEKLGILYDSVEHHIENLFVKSGAGSSTELFPRLRAETNAYNLPEEQVSLLAASYNEFLQRIKTLTASEHEIFDLYLRGFTAQQISDERRCSLRTVKFHNKNIYAKLGIASQKELMLLAKMMLEDHSKLKQDEDK